MSTTVNKNRHRGVEVGSIGVAHIHASFNNTIITITNVKGDTICWASSGSVGYKGSKKATPYAASRVGLEVATKAMKAGIRAIEVYKYGVAAGADQAIRSLLDTGLSISVLHDVTPIAHNGCRPKKKKRG